MRCLMVKKTPFKIDFKEEHDRNVLFVSYSQYPVRAFWILKNGVEVKDCT